MNTFQQPNQVIPESQKGLDWMKQNADAIKSMSFQNSASRRKDIECWYMYHNIYNEKELLYVKSCCTCIRRRNQSAGNH